MRINILFNLEKCSLRDKHSTWSFQIDLCETTYNWFIHKSPKMEIKYLLSIEWTVWCLHSKNLHTSEKNSKLLIHETIWIRLEKLCKVDTKDIFYIVLFHLYEIQEQVTIINSDRSSLKNRGYCLLQWIFWDLLWCNKYSIFIWICN